MTTPVFVIHGVANHDQDAFAATVTTLGNTIDDLDLRPVFWGDLGAQDTYLADVIPSIDIDENIRGTASPEGQKPLSPTELELIKGLLSDPTTTRTDRTAAVRDGENPADGPGLIAEAATRRGGQVDNAVRGQESEWQALLEDIWPELDYLPQVQDPAILRGIGEALVEPDTELSTGQEVRGASDWLKQRVHDMDRAVGAVVGAVAGRVNTYARTMLGPSIARFAGDIAVYQRNQDRIHARVREVLANYDVVAGLTNRPIEQRTGGAANPANFICHSLGGVVALDLATALSEPVHIRGLLTFGSQWPLFQLCDPRSGIPPYTGESVTLPTTIGKWVNLWEPMDPLAFVAGRVFNLSDGSRPEDRIAVHLATSGLMTHSAYWKLPELPKAARYVFTA